MNFTLIKVRSKKRAFYFKFILKNNGVTRISCNEICVNLLFCTISNIVC